MARKLSYLKVSQRNGRGRARWGEDAAKAASAEAARCAAPDNLKQVTCGTGELSRRALGAIIHEEDDPGTKRRRRRSSGP